MNSPTAAALLAATPIEVFKHDHRSRVWRVRVDGSDYVIKRFEHSRIKQTLARWMGRHPAQREARMARRLAADGVAVVPVAARGTHHGRSWVATRRVGASVQRLLTDGQLGGRDARAEAARALADLLADLLDRGWFFRDFQTANIVLEEPGRAWLIDVGSVRRSARRDHAVRMLALLDHTASGEGATRRDRLTFLNRLIERRPGLGPRKPLAAQIAARRAAVYDARATQA